MRYGGATEPLGFRGLTVMRFRERPILDLLCRQPSSPGLGSTSHTTYALVALGFVVIYKPTGVINFA